MTAILIALLTIAFYFQWSPLTISIIAGCTILALTLDTRAATTRKTHQ